LQQIKQLQNKVAAFDRLQTKYDDAVTMAELGIEAQDESVVQESEILTKQFMAAYERFRIETLLSGEYDANNAIITLHSGAGGTESCDWVGMLYRMYAQWAQKRSFKFEELDLLEGEEAGIKSVTFQISGENAFGYMKCEKGVHRLVRISPFDSSGRRHTSFASCDVMPELDDDNLIEINPDDLKVDTYRSSGAGGQHVNKTESAIRITHIPTGIIVQCQNERSQIKNRDRAMKMLKAKLYVLRQEEQMAKLNGIRGEVKDIAWGSQIRSYVFHPYSMVKDHRTNEEVGNVQGVMDGALDNFMNAYLVWAARKDA
jgi:peptide chain release factor 2